MSEESSEKVASQSLRQHLQDVRHRLLDLHKKLLDMERLAYERVHGRVVSRGELLQLVIEHEQFAWLHSISELIVRMDLAFDGKEPMTVGDAAALLRETENLLKPAETGTLFQRKYDAALQNEPEAIFAHREMIEGLSQARHYVSRD